MSEQLRNNAETTLSSGINSSVTSLTVASATPFPTTGNFRIRIDNELLLVTAVSGTTFTVTRGIESTTAASHSSGVKIVLVLTEKGLEAYVGDYILGGTMSALPSPLKAGRLYFPSDGFVLFRDNGSAWEASGPLFPMIPPVASGYAWANQQSATYTQRADGIFMDGGTPAGSAWSLRCLTKNRLSTTTGYKLTVGVMPQFAPSNFSMLGAGLYETSSGKSEFFRFQNDSGEPRVSACHTTAFESGSISDIGTTLVTKYSGACPLVNWFQIEQTSTNLIFRYSIDGQNWIQIETHTITSYFTASPDKMFLYIMPYSQVTKGLFMSVKEES